jgi:hypothetical protein
MGTEFADSRAKDLFPRLIGAVMLSGWRLRDHLLTG